ncbi:MAG: LacI family DNA-binding transcriptional regulator [Rhodospirillaceae bacterium]|nr:LacI family DNA-binding transcriptional regulator [Rhodospirillaceae bacterium]
MATIRDVARRAGVSIATVSRVVNEQPGIRPETRARVHDAIDELSFRPNAIGRSLKAGTSRVLGVMVPTLANPVFAEAVEGLQHEARKAGYGVMVTTSDYDADTERAAVETLMIGRVDALVLTVRDAADAATRAWLDAIDRPVVLIYNEPGSRPTVTVDNAAAGAAAAEMFVRLGHSRLAVVAGSLTGSDRSRARWLGFANALQAQGCPPPVKVEIPFHQTDLGQAIADLMAGDAPPTGLFCSNDLIAMRTMAALRELGLGVPGDVSVMGFDGIATCRLLHPSLSTVSQPSRTMGEAAATLVLKELAGGVAEPFTILPHRLVEGGSVGPPPRAAQRGPTTSPTERGVPST